MKKRRLTLRNKLILLPLFSVVLTLAGVGVSLNYLIKDQFVQRMQTVLESALSDLRNDFRERNARLLGDAAGLGKREELVSSASLIHNYQDPARYQPLIFDVEKQKISKELSTRLRLSGHTLFALYDPEGVLIAAALRESSNRLAEVILSYQDQNPTPPRRGGPGERGFDPGS